MANPVSLCLFIDSLKSTFGKQIIDNSHCITATAYLQGVTYCLKFRYLTPLTTVVAHSVIRASGLFLISVLCLTQYNFML